MGIPKIISAKNKAPHIFQLLSMGSPRLGYLTPTEFPTSLPFPVKRVYWTFHTPHAVRRGHHAHKKLQQVAVAVSGSIKFRLESHSGQKYSFTLDRPNKALFIPCGYWRTIYFSHNAVLLCLASRVYEANDYIRDYSEFRIKR